jgi:sulfatase maturation enzyme AslB (radical SAM superfamily)
MYHISDIRNVHLEISTRCNAACPGCPRNLCGVNVVEGYPLHDMSLAEAQSIFSPAFLQQLESILINGNLGDFVTARDGVEIVRYFREQNPKLKIEISTNADARPDIWPTLAELKVQVFFCIDGLKTTHEQYRRQTDWDSVIANAQAFISNGGNAVWKMISFAHNQHEIDQCKAMSQQLGFNRFLLVDQGRDAFPVFDQKKNFLYSIGEHTQPTNFDELYNRYLGSTTNGYIEPVDADVIDCKVQKKKSIYVTATGEIYPCCWLGFYPRTMWNMGNSQIAPMLPNNNNANQIGIESAMQWFNKISDAWTHQPPVQCKINCGSKTDSQ